MKIVNCKLKIAKHKGFTLIEILVVIFVLGIGLIGALSFFNINMNNQFEAKNELIAAGLAQESTDLVRNVVDYNYLNQVTISHWYTEIANNSNGNSNCKLIDFYSLGSHQCESSSSSKKQRVCFDDTNNRYYQCPNASDAGATDFYREVTVTGENVNGSGVNLDTGDCIKVIATVTWNGRETKATDIICEPRQ
jgi:prepilin-type N-terminal cleavage/methylation domain-containing protein